MTQIDSPSLVEPDVADRAPIARGFWLKWVMATIIGGAAGVVGGASAGGPIASVAAFFLALPVGLVLDVATPYRVGMEGAVAGAFLLTAIPILATVLGLTVGTAQRLALGWQGRDALPFIAWVLASAGGSGVGGLLYGCLAIVVGLSPYASSIFESVVPLAIYLSALVGMVMFGCMLGGGMAQALWFLPQRPVSRVGWWALAVTIGAVTAMSLLIMGTGATALLVEQSLSARQVGLEDGFTALEDTLFVGGFVLGGLVGWFAYGAITGAVMARLLRQPTAPEGGAGRA